MIIFADFDNTLFFHDNPAATAENFRAAQKFRQAGLTNLAKNVVSFVA